MFLALRRVSIEQRRDRSLAYLPWRHFIRGWRPHYQPNAPFLAPSQSLPGPRKRPVGQVPRECPWREGLWSRLVAILASVSRQCNHDIVEGAEEDERRGPVGSRHGGHTWSHTVTIKRRTLVRVCAWQRSIMRPLFSFYPWAWLDLSSVRSGGLRCQDDPRSIIPGWRDLPNCQTGAASRSGSKA